MESEVRSRIGERLIAYWKKETVQVIAAVLAILSCFLVPPSAEYLAYINYKVLILLFCLMSVVAGMKQIGVFDALCSSLLQRVHSVRGLMLLLSVLSFFLSMFLTNDVTLVTVVPFTIMVFGKRDSRNLIMTLILETVATNLGSMFTPFGNPQNLFLYAAYEFDFVAFLTLMLPYTLLSLLLVIAACLILGGNQKMAENRDDRKAGQRSKSLEDGQNVRAQDAAKSFSEIFEYKTNRLKFGVYLLLFALSILAVARVLDIRILLALTLLGIGVMDWKLFRQVDYALLLTFVFFFVFVGNMGKVEWVSEFLRHQVAGRELPVAILASQMISNVPAAVLLEQFTDVGSRLVVGVNLGGLGTLIASMASLITYKFYAGMQDSHKGKYLLFFTVVNLVFLVVLCGMAKINGIL